MPAYVLTFVLLGQHAVALPQLRSTGGAILVLTLVLYPYVYLLGRAAFVSQSRGLLEAARSLGHTQLDSIVRIALPLARPALAGGAALAVMEALADFGAVNLLNYRALTDAIYRVWYGAFDRAAALQLGALGLVAMLVAAEQLSRRGRSTEQGGAPGDIPRRRLSGPRALAAMAAPGLLLAVVVVAPVVQLGAWAITSLRDGTYDASLLADARNSLLLAFLAAAAAVALAVVIVYGVRLRPTRPRRGVAQGVALGYAIPGSVVAAAVFLVADSVGDVVGVALTGSLVALLLAYVVRFTSLALLTVDARMATIPSALDAAARSLGAGRGRLLGEIHLPLLAPAVGTAALLVFVEVLKELPATVLLRPFGTDTLAIAVWEATRESLYETAAFPALCIVGVGVIPVIVLVRLTGRRA
jgi:iron(III) transport system permease protein